MADNLTPEQIDRLNEALERLIGAMGGEVNNRKRTAEELLKDIKSLEGLRKVVGTTTSALGTLKDGIQGAGAFNGALDKGADVIDKFASTFGKFGSVLGMAVTAGVKYVGAVNKQSDALFKAYQDISKVGAVGAGGMAEIFSSMQKFGYGIEQLGEMTALLKENSTALASFGGTAFDGSRQFANLATQIQRSNIGRELMYMGKSVDDINRGAAGYIKQEVGFGQTRSQINADLATKTANYIKELDMLSRLTGESREQQEQKIAEAQAEEAFNQTQYELKKRAAAGDAEAAKMYARNQELNLRLTGEARQEFIRGVGGDLSAMSKTMMTAPEAVRMIGDSSKTASDYIDALARGAIRTRDAVGSLAKFNAYNQTFLRMDETSQLQARMAEESAETQKERAKIEQDLAAKGLDPATRAAVDLRIEQMNTRDALQKLVNLGINPVTKAMSGLAGVISGITNVPGKIAPSIAPGGAKPIGGGGTPGGPFVPPGGGAPGAAPAKGQGAFYNQMYNSLYAAAKAQGIPNPEAIAKLGAAQASLETGYGKHVVGQNYFGIKGTGSRGTVQAGTQEFVGGRMVGMKQGFRAYGSMEESASDYIAFLKQNPRYQSVLGAGSAEEAIAAQGRTGYATDPAYATKLAKIYSTYGSNLPAGPTSGYQSTMAGTSPSAQLPQSQASGQVAPNKNFADQDSNQLSKLMSQVLGQLETLNKTSANTLNVNQKILQHAS